MSAGANVERIFVLPPFRMSYPTLITPRQYQGKGDKTFSCGMIFEPDALSKVHMLDDKAENGFSEVDLATVLVALAKEKWSGINVKEEFAKTWPIKNGDTLAKKAEDKKKNADHLKGMKYLNAKSKENVRPKLVVFEGGTKVVLDPEVEADKKKVEKFFVAGSWAKAVVKVMPTEVNENKYLTFYLNELRYVKPGPRIGGVSIMDRFEGVTGGSSDHDPTAGLDDEIPF